MSAQSPVDMKIPVARVVDGVPSEVRGCMRWYPDDPFAVSLLFGSHIWTTSRETLRDGLVGAPPVGELRVLNRGSYLLLGRKCMERDGQVTVVYRVATSDMARFLKATEEEMSPEAASAAVQVAVDRLLGLLGVA